MVRAIVALAHNLGMDVVAEGVETPDQLSQLRALGCEYAQGFYLLEAGRRRMPPGLIHAEPWRFQESFIAAARR